MLKSENFGNFPWNSKLENREFFSAKSKTLREFSSAERKLSFSRVDIPGKIVQILTFRQNLFGGNTIYYSKFLYLDKETPLIDFNSYLLQIKIIVTLF